MHTKNITLLERSKVLATKEDFWKVKTLQTSTDVIQTCTRKRTKMKWKMYKQINITFFVAPLKTFPWCVKLLYCQIRSCKNQHINCLTFEEKTWKPYIDSFCVFVSSELQPCIGMEMRDLKRNLPYFTMYSRKKLVRLILQIFEVVSSNILQQWTTLFAQIRSCTTLPLQRDLRLASLLRGVLGSPLMLYEYYVSVVTFAISPITTLSSKPIVVQRVIISFW